MLSQVQLFATPWTVAHQAPLSMGFSRQEYWTGLPCPLPGDLSNPGIEPTSLMSPVLVGRFFITSATWEAPIKVISSVQSLSLVRLFVTPWTIAQQAPLSMEFSRQEYQSGLPIPLPGDLSNPGIKPVSPVSPALTADCFLPLSHLGRPPALKQSE